jgi:hypothetical protein
VQQRHVEGELSCSSSATGGPCFRPVPHISPPLSCVLLHAGHVSMNGERQGQEHVGEEHGWRSPNPCTGRHLPRELLHAGAGADRSPTAEARGRERWRGEESPNEAKMSTGGGSAVAPAQRRRRGRRHRRRGGPRARVAAGCGRWVREGRGGRMGRVVLGVSRFVSRRRKTQNYPCRWRFFHMSIPCLAESEATCSDRRAGHDKGGA